jgi:hypothetical protein
MALPRHLSREYPAGSSQGRWASRPFRAVDLAPEDPAFRPVAIDPKEKSAIGRKCRSKCEAGPICGAAIGRSGYFTRLSATSVCPPEVEVGLRYFSSSALIEATIRRCGSPS